MGACSMERLHPDLFIGMKQGCHMGWVASTCDDIGLFAGASRAHERRKPRKKKPRRREGRGDGARCRFATGAGQAPPPYIVELRGGGGANLARADLGHGCRREPRAFFAEVVAGSA